MQFPKSNFQRRQIYKVPTKQHQIPSVSTLKTASKHLRSKPAKLISHVGKFAPTCKFTTWEKNTKPTDLYITCYRN